MFQKLIFTSCIVVFFLLPVGASATQQTITPVDRAVPEFNLPGTEGEQWNNETLLGKPWLINFWAVWCAPCLEELPALNRAWDSLEDQDVGMLAVNIGGEAEDITRFLKDHDLQIDFPIVIGDKIRTLGNWSARSLPFTVVVSPDGKVVYEANGPREWDDPRFIEAITDLKTAKSE